MTLGFGLLTLGAILIATALQNRSVGQILRGEPGPGQPPDILGSGTGASGAGGKNGAGRVAGAGGYPLAKHGSIIGTPHVGTHTLGNWQSDNAYDISAPVGTDVLAVGDGKLSGAGGIGGKNISSQFAGKSVYLNLSDGTQVWYKHLVSLSKTTGKVRAGEVIGKSGGGNGVPHLHFAAKPPAHPDRWVK